MSTPVKPPGWNSPLRSTTQAAQRPDALATHTLQPHWPCQSTRLATRPLKFQNIARNQPICDIRTAPVGRFRQLKRELVEQDSCWATEPRDHQPDPFVGIESPRATKSTYETCFLLRQPVNRQSRPTTAASLIHHHPWPGQPDLVYIHAQHPDQTGFFVSRVQLAPV